MKSFGRLCALMLALTLLLTPALAQSTELPLPGESPVESLPPVEDTLPAEENAGEEAPSAEQPAPIVIYEYREGLARAEQNGLWGFANPAGQITVPIRYDAVSDFSLGIALVEKDGKTGIVRPDGAELLPTEYDTLTDIGFGLYLAQKGDRWGVVSLLAFSDSTGTLTHDLFPIAYTSARITSLGGLEVLQLVGEEGTVTHSLSSLPALMISRQIPSSQFPTIKNRTPSFSDTGARDWFTVWSDLAYNLGLMEGVGEGRFAPRQTLTVAEVIKLAAFLESQSTDDDFHLQPITSSPWYSSSVAYCVATGIISAQEFDDYERPITRAEMVHILSKTSLGRRLPEINSLSTAKASVPDVKPGDYAAESIYLFYAKGLLAGTDENQTFNPNGLLTRAEAAAVVCRMARAEQRVLLWGGQLPYTMTEQKLQVSAPSLSADLLPAA